GRAGPRRRGQSEGVSGPSEDLMSGAPSKMWGKQSCLVAGIRAGFRLVRKLAPEAGRKAGLQARLLAPLACPLLFLSPLRAETLENVLRQMDNAAASFQSLTAHIRNVKYTAIVDDKTVDEGTLFVKRVKPRVSVLLIEFTVPETYYVSISE